jgi:hypothetical protein
LLPDRTADGRELLRVTKTSGPAARIVQVRCHEDDEGVRVFGDAVTGGGILVGTDFLRVDGVTDTTGTDPRVATCGQAIEDMRTASATLATLPVTRDLGTLRPNPNDDWLVELVADPGVNVWTAKEIAVFDAGNTGTEIRIVLDPATESVILNVGRIQIRKYSQITVVGDPAKVALNVVGRSTSRLTGRVAPRILAGEGKIVVRVYGNVHDLLADRVQVIGGDVR